MCSLADKARNDGRWARLQGMGLDCCPHRFGCPNAFAWVAGWQEEDKEASDAIAGLRNEDKRLGRVRKL